MYPKLKIQVVVGSVREGCASSPVARWVHAGAGEHIDAELVDLADWPLPMFALARPPAMGDYKDSLQKRWAAKIGEADGYVLVSPEYNHSTSAVLKNALDYLYAEWNRKPVAFAFSDHVSLVLGLGPLKSMLHFHDKLIEAIKRRDANGASEAVAENFRETDVRLVMLADRTGKGA